MMQTCSHKTERERSIAKIDENGHRIKNKYNSIKGQRYRFAANQTNILSMFPYFVSIQNSVSSVITIKAINLEN